MIYQMNEPFHGGSGGPSLPSSNELGKFPKEGKAIGR